MDDISSRPFSMRPVFYVHVRRTGGGTVRNAFQQVVPVEKRFPPEGNCQMEDYLWAKAREYPYVAGHFWMNQWLTLNLPHKFLVVLRDPVEQQVALWHSVKYRIDVCGQNMGEKFTSIIRMGLENAIESGEIRCLFDRTLFHVSSYETDEVDYGKHVESAMSNLKASIVGFLDEIEIFVQKCAHYAELPAPGNIDQRFKNAFVDPLDTYLFAKMKSYLEPDANLYEWARKELK